MTIRPRGNIKFSTAQSNWGSLMFYWVYGVCTMLCFYLYHFCCGFVNGYLGRYLDRHLSRYLDTCCLTPVSKHSRYIKLLGTDSTKKAYFTYEVLSFLLSPLLSPLPLPLPGSWPANQSAALKPWFHYWSQSRYPANGRISLSSLRESYGGEPPIFPSFQSSAQ